MAVALAGQVDLDWDEVQRLAERLEYCIVPELRTMAREVAHELGRSDPYHS